MIRSVSCHPRLPRSRNHRCVPANSNNDDGDDDDDDDNEDETDEIDDNDDLMRLKEARSCRRVKIIQYIIQRVPFPMCLSVIGANELRLSNI